MASVSGCPRSSPACSGFFDLAAYDSFLSGRMVDEEITDARFAAGLATVPAVPAG